MTKISESELLEDCQPILAKNIQPDDVIFVPFHDSFCAIEVIVKDTLSITLMFKDGTNYITIPSQVFLKRK